MSSPDEEKRAVKVCMLVDTNFVEDRRVRKEAKTLLDAGYQVTVIAFRSWFGMGTELPNEKIQMFEGIKLIYVDSPKIDYQFGPLRFILNFVRKRIRDSYRLIKYAKSENADIYHSHDLDTLFEGFVAAKRNKAKLIYDSHEFFTEVKLPGSYSWRFYRPYWKIIERLLIKHVDGMITVCELFADEFSKRYGITHPVILHNTPELRPLKKLDLIRERFKIPSDQKVILYLGSLFPGRGAEITIDSAAYLDDNVALVIIGPATEDYRKQIQERANKIKTARIIVEDAIPPSEVYDYLMSADLGIVFYENTCFANNSLSNKLFDYMLSGLPVVASAMSETRRIIQETESGIALGNADAEELGNTITQILQDEESLERFRENARMSVEERYNWAVETEKLLKLYEGILKSYKSKE